MNAQKTNNIQTLRDIEKQMASLNVPSWLWDEGRHKIISANREAVKFWGELSVFDLIDQLFGENHPLAVQFGEAAKQLKTSIKPIDSKIDFNVVNIEQNTNCQFSAIKTQEDRSFVMVKVMPAQKIETIPAATSASNSLVPEEDMIGKMLDNAPVTLALFSADGTFNYANEAARHLFSNSENQFSEPKNLTDWLAKDNDSDKISALIEQAGQYKIANDSMELSTSFGDRMHNIVAKSLSLGEGEQKEKYILTYIRDVADERDYEQLLMDRISRLETLTKIGSDFNFILDEELNFVQIGGNFEMLTGFETSEIEGRSWLEIAYKFGLDPDGTALDHFTSATSFDNLLVAWPVKGSEEKVHLSWRGRAIYEKENGEKRFVGSFVTAFENILAFDASDLENDLALQGVSAKDLSVSEHVELIEDDSLDVDVDVDVDESIDILEDVSVETIEQVADLAEDVSNETSGASAVAIAAIGAAATVGAVLTSDANADQVKASDDASIENNVSEVVEVEAVIEEIETAADAIKVPQVEALKNVAEVEIDAPKEIVAEVEMDAEVVADVATEADVETIKETAAVEAEVKPITAEVLTNDAVIAVEAETENAPKSALEKAYLTNANKMIKDANILPMIASVAAVAAPVLTKAVTQTEETALDAAVEAPKGEAIMSYLGDASNLEAATSDDAEEIDVEISELADETIKDLNIDAVTQAVVSDPIDIVEPREEISEIVERVEEKAAVEQNIITETSDKIAAMAANFSATTSDVTSDALEGAKDKLSEVSQSAEAVTDEFSAKIAAVKAEAAKLVAEIKEEAEAKKQQLTEAVEAKVETIEASATETIDAISDKVDAVKSTVAKEVEEKSEMISSTVETAKTETAAKLEETKSLLNEQTDNVTSMIDEKLSRAKEKLDIVKSDLNDRADEITDKFDGKIEDASQIETISPSDDDQKEKSSSRLGLKKILGGAGVASVIGAFVGKKTEKKDNIFKASNDDDKTISSIADEKIDEIEAVAEDVTSKATEIKADLEAATDEVTSELVEKVEDKKADLTKISEDVKSEMVEVADIAVEKVEQAEVEISNTSDELTSNVTNNIEANVEALESDIEDNKDLVEEIALEATDTVEADIIEANTELSEIDIEAKIDASKIEILEANIADKMEKIENDLDAEDASIQTIIEKADLNEEEADHFAQLAQKINASVDDTNIENIEDFADEADEAEDMLADNIIPAFGAQKANVAQMGKTDVDMFKTVLDQTPVIALLSRIPMSDEANILFANKQARSAFNIQDDQDDYLNALKLNLSHEVDAQMFDATAEPIGQNVIVRYKGEIMNFNAKINKVSWRNDDALQYILVPLASVEKKLEKAKIDQEVMQSKLVELDETNVEDESLNQDVAQFILDGQAFIDDEYNILFANKHLSRMVNKRTDELVGQPIDALIKREHVNIFQDYAVSILTDDQKSLSLDGVEIDLLTGDGDPVSIFLYISKLEEDLAKDFASNILVNMRDISKWKRKEANLREAKERAEQDNIQKSGFLARISHELRTPLNAIIGFSEVMSDEKFGPLDNSRYKGYANDINESGEHLLSLINDLLDLSKIEAGSVELNFKALELAPIIAQSVSLMQPMADKKRIAIRTSIASNIPQIIADTRSIRQIILNLMSNSIKYSNPGSQVIISALIDDDGEVILRVRDTGVGMDNDQLKSAMEPFKTVDMATIVDKNGTGLGLPLTKALAEANRAEFNIESATDAGTLVQITFPTTRVLTQ